MKAIDYKFVDKVEDMELKVSVANEHREASEVKSKISLSNVVANKGRKELKFKRVDTDNLSYRLQDSLTKLEK
jgi:Holliday junction resolvase RusA-like endonuclease